MTRQRNPKAGRAPADDKQAAHFVLDGGRLTLESLDAALGGRVQVEIAGAVWECVEANCEAVRRIAHREVRKEIPHAEKDRLFGDDIRTSLALLRSQRVVRAVEKEIGPFK